MAKDLEVRDSYSIAIIGAGSAGLTAADFAVKLEAKTLLVEANKIGGDCTWTGCVPSKALIKVAKAAHITRHASDYGIMGVPKPEDVVVDMKKVVDYVQSAVEKVYAQETPEVLKEKGCHVAIGSASFVEPQVLKIEPTDGSDAFHVEARRVLICTGAKPNIPDFIIQSGVPYLTYENIFQLTTLPSHLIVIGGGPIGCEMAQAFRRLGAAVTIVSTSIMPKEDKDAREVIGKVFAAEGIHHIADRSSAVTTCQYRDQDGIEITTTSGSKVQGSHLLVATGRKPILQGLNLEAAGIEVEDGAIKVNDYLHTSTSHIYAAGDCAGFQQFTHLAGLQGFTAIRNMTLPSRATGDFKLVPRATFTDPEVASVGISEEVFKFAYGGWSVDASLYHQNAVHANVVTRPLTRVDRAVCEGDEQQGFIKLLFDDGLAVHGATIVCQRAGEMINEIAVCMQHGIRLDKLARVMHAYPSFAMALQQIAGDVATDHTLSGFAGKLLNWFKKV
eukprot:TRINITY_DN11646_c0_g4_i1.p1 TRINITY_DN11646_c0_g4~~TRINITY_DN11646_c0_g4_i1.p1  ORF type:complete len:502 (+),score=108.20 TRINITY_DN11646_c0_g4_i1:133-1638(+)